MDTNILRNIVSSSSVPASVESSSEWQLVKERGEFPVINDVVIDGLSKTLTKHLSYKVSQEAYQRYSVRLHIIDTLRSWSRVKGDIGKLPIFQDSERASTFLIGLLKKYLTDDTLSTCEDTDNLVQVAEVLLNSLAKSRSLIRRFEKVIERITDLKQTEKSERFLLNLIKKSDDLILDSSVLEKVYMCQKSQLIEKPLTDCFVEYCSNQSKLENLSKINIVFEKITSSPLLFQLLSNQLKEFFVMTKYAEVAQSFIRIILNKIEEECAKCKKDTLELYPTSVQFCVILLRIQPSLHTEESKTRTVQSLKQVFLSNYDHALILVSHFPEWLPDYLQFFDDLEELTQRMVIEDNDETTE